MHFPRLYYKKAQISSLTHEQSAVEEAATLSETITDQIHVFFFLTRLVQNSQRNFLPDFFFQLTLSLVVQLCEKGFILWET